MKNYKLAIVGATGLVGRTALQILEEMDLPISEYVFFASAKSAGTKLNFKNQEYIVRELTDSSFDDGFDSKKSKSKEMSMDSSKEKGAGNWNL